MSQENNTTVNYPTEFKGFAVADPTKWDSPELISFEPKQFRDSDIDVEIECNGVCGSDIHTLKNDWSPDVKVMCCHNSSYGPKAQIVGHEIVGKIVKMGPNADPTLSIGQRVGITAICDVCGECSDCKNGNEQYCSKYIGTYAHPYSDGYVSQGGYASHVRVPSSMIIPIPDALKSEYVAPLLCGGLTVYSPIKRYIGKILEKQAGSGITPRVGVIGVGGLGHMAIMIAKAYGCEVIGISRSSSKREDALKMGATDFIATGGSDEDNDKEKINNYKRSFDLLINCASTNSGLDFPLLAPMLKINCFIVTVGVGKIDEMLTVSPLVFILNGCGFAGSALGSKREAVELLNLAVEQKFHPWVETIPISESGVREALTRLDAGDVKYRFTLIDYHKFFNTGK